MAAGIGIIVVLLGALGLLNPRGQPFVFNLQASMDDFWSYVHQYAIPRWHAGAYLLLAAHVAWAADSGVKYPVLKRARSVLGLKTLEERVSRKMRRNSQPWSPSFAARFTVGLCGILVVLFSVLLACAVSNSLLGVSMAAVFDELPFFNQRTDDSSHLALCETLDRMIQASNTPEQALSATLALCNVALHSRSAAALLRALHALLRAQATGVLDGAAAVPRTRCVRDLLGMLPTPTSCSVTRSPRIWHQP